MWLDNIIKLNLFMFAECLTHPGNTKKFHNSRYHNCFYTILIYINLLNISLILVSHYQFRRSEKVGRSERTLATAHVARWFQSSFNAKHGTHYVGAVDPQLMSK
jgi:hypothetical protein